MKFIIIWPILIKKNDFKWLNFELLILFSKRSLIWKEMVVDLFRIVLKV